MTQLKTFSDLNLSESTLSALDEIGFVSPSHIQEKCIPHLLEGKDVLAVAQTGSGKTAAFMLPAIETLDFSLNKPQVLVVAPTHELAIQITEATKQFSLHRRVRIATLFGGQSYEIQLRSLRNGAQIVIGTPGRIIDHIKRNTLKTDSIKLLILDEADEMLKMGFIDSISEIMATLPEHQSALFSATMPDSIAKLSANFMNDPIKIEIEHVVKNQPNISQYFWKVRGFSKKEALVRFLEIKPFDAAIIFTKTKLETLEVSAVLEQNNFKSAALNGDMTQQLREQTISRIKNGSLDIIVATDIAARGIDIDRISLVVNYDAPQDAESYTHRIGRTGRAGRSGEALIFLDYREAYMLNQLKKVTNSEITEIQVPNSKVLESKRRELFIESIYSQFTLEKFATYKELLQEMFGSIEDFTDLSVAMMMLLESQKKLILPPDNPDKFKPSVSRNNPRDRKVSRFDRDRSQDSNSTTYKISLGKKDGIQTKHIVGAIANELNTTNKAIGKINIFDSFTLVDLSITDKDIERLSNVKILNLPITISKDHHEKRRFNDNETRSRRFNNGDRYHNREGRRDNREGRDNRDSNRDNNRRQFNRKKY